MDTVEKLPVLNVNEDLKWLSSERVQPTWLTEHFGLWHNDRTLFAAVPEENLRRICEYLFDEEEFLSPHGIRSLSKYYEKNPYSFCEGEASATLAYSPADSPVAMFGGKLVSVGASPPCNPSPKDCAATAWESGSARLPRHRG